MSNVTHTRKYGSFERVTPGKLSVGELLLVRPVQGDGILDDDLFEELCRRRNSGEDISYRSIIEQATVPAGVHAIDRIDVTWSEGWRKASRYYVLTLRFSDDQLVRRVRLAAIQKVNRVVEPDGTIRKASGEAGK